MTKQTPQQRYDKKQIDKDLKQFKRWLKPHLFERVDKYIKRISKDNG